MIRSIPNLYTAVFGLGTVCISPNINEKFSGYLDLMQCKKAPIGSEIILTKTNIRLRPKIRLSFQTTESIDALVSKLQDLKAEMLERTSNESTEKVL